MAMISIEEPRVKVSERIRETPTILDIDGSSNVGGVIVAPRGPRLSYVSGPADFLRKYTVDGEVPRNADKTFINAYYLSYSTGLVIARSMNTQAIEGLVFSPINSAELKLPITIENDSFWGIGISGKYYWCYSNANWEKFKAEARAVTKEDGTPRYEDVISNIDKFYDGDDKIIKVNNILDLASKLQDNLRSANASDASKIGVAYSSLVGGLVITGVDSTKITLDSNNINCTSDVPNSTSKVGLKADKIKFKDGSALTKTEYLDIEITDDKKWAFTFGSLAYYHGPIDKSKFADYSLKLCTSINNVVNSINGIKGMSAELVSGNAADAKGEFIIRVDYSEGNKLYTGTSDDLIVNVNKDKLDYTNTSTGTATVEQSLNGVVNKYADGNSIYDSGKYMFAIFADAPQDSDIYKVSIRNDEGNLFVIGLDDGQKNQEFTVSLLADELDQSGSNAYIENLNALGLNFTVIVNSEFECTGTEINAALGESSTNKIPADKVNNKYLGEDAFTYLTPKATQIFSFGDSGLSLSTCKEVSCITNALYELEDQEQYDIEYLAPFGMTDLTFIKNYILVGKNNDWFTPVDIPYQKTNANSIKGYFLNIDSTSNAIGMGPFDKNTGLTGWLNYIACSTLYYTKIYNNKAQRKEFAPVFDITNGILDFTNPVYMIGKEDRVKLLNFKCPVNFLVYDMRHTCYYLNDNRTHQPEVNVVSEEQNRRIVNKIKKDLKRLLGRFKGRYNTVTTRNDVISQIGLYFTDNIMNQGYAPNKYEVICDETNNTDDMIVANKLGVTVRVQLYNAIKFVDVLVDVFPLSVDFTS
jgi:hypothetical protein